MREFLIKVAIKVLLILIKEGAPIVIEKVTAALQGLAQKPDNDINYTDVQKIAKNEQKLIDQIKADL